MLKLAYGLSFAELHERDGLARLDAAFLDHLGAAESALRPQLEAARATASLDPKSESALILEIAPHLDDFLAELFGIRGIPTLMLFKNGNVEATRVGALSKSQLTAFLDSNI